MTGWVAKRFTLLCNGVTVTQPTGTKGKLVAAVDFDAWQLTLLLYPMNGAQVPLVFDVYDSWARRLLCGCTYYVAPPSGPAYETFPLNANAAGARRRSRFFAHGHTPAPMKVLRTDTSRAHPRTLDLRRCP